jgi:hypothetical protein
MTEPRRGTLSPVIHNRCNKRLLNRDELNQRSLDRYRKQLPLSPAIEFQESSMQSPQGVGALTGLMFFSGQSCPNCNAAIHGAVAAEYVSDTHVRNIWWCDSCNQLSRTSIFLDFDARKSVNIAASGRHPGRIERPPPGRDDGRSARRARPPHSAAYLRRWFRMASAGQATQPVATPPHALDNLGARRNAPQRRR